MRYPSLDRADETAAIVYERLLDRASVVGQEAKPPLERFGVRITKVEPSKTPAYFGVTCNPVWAYSLAWV
jgi:hypothetical protein